MSLISPNQYNDDKWHTIEASRFGKHVLLKVDGEDISGSEAANGLSTDLKVCVTIGNCLFLRYYNFEYNLHDKVSEHLYIGGYPGDHEIKDVTNFYYDGCLDSVQIGKVQVNLNKNINAYGIISGCPVKVIKWRCRIDITTQTGHKRI